MFLYPAGNLAFIVSHCPVPFLHEHPSREGVHMIESADVSLSASEELRNGARNW
jgi:hypothetical protein